MLVKSMVYQIFIEWYILTRPVLNYKLLSLMATVSGNIRPEQLVKKHQCLHNSIEINELPRLKSLVNNPFGKVDYRLQFGVDEHGAACVTGKVSTDIELICQRCLNTMPVSVNSEVKIGLAFKEENLKSLPGVYEPLLITEETISLFDLLEDEVLLSVPMAPVHDVNMCPSDDLVSKHRTNKKNPFDVLKTLKK